MDRRRGSRDASAVDDDDRALKRRRQSSEHNEPRQVFDAVWVHQERNRNIRQHFEVLPDKNTYPDYYVKITNPISLQEIRAKLDQNQYATVEDIKKDLFLMCDNATLYNKAKSQVHADALRLRKVTEMHFEPRAKREPESTPGRTSTRGSKGGPAAFQQAQSSIVDDLLNLKSSDGISISQHFKNLPSRKYWADYFRLIERPISLKQISNKVRDGHYRQWADFEEDVCLIRKNAEQYNREGTDIIKHARYLEEYFLKRVREEKLKLGDPVSSGIKLRFNITAEQAQVAPDQASVAPIPVPKIKLNVGSKQSSGQPPVAPPQQPVRPPTQAGASVPMAVLTDMNGLRNPVSVPVSAPVSVPASPPAAPTIALPVSRLESASQASPTPPAHDIQDSVQSSARADNSIQPSTATPVANGTSASPTPTRLDSLKSNGSYNGSHSPPNGTIVRLSSRSETPHSQIALSPPGTLMPPPMQRVSSTPRPSSFSPAPSVTRPSAPPHGYQEPVLRPEGKDKTDALITNVRITSISTKNPEDVFVRNLLPDDNKVTSQYFLHLPAEYQTILIVPTLAPSLVGRAYALRAELVLNNIQQRKTIQRTHQEQSPNEPEFQLLLMNGVNTVEVTAVTQVAPKSNGINGTPATGLERWEMERFRVYVVPMIV